MLKLVHSFHKHSEMSLFILITLQLFLEVKTEGLPQAKLTVFPASVSDGKMRLVCEGFDNRTVSECFFYPSGQENFTTPSVSCELSLTGSELITWSGDEESSYVNTVCYYTVSGLGKYITSAHSDEVSVKVRDSTATSSTSPTTDSISTVTFSTETSQEMLFFITVAGTGVGIVLVGLMGVCMYGCTRKQRTLRIWIESTSKEHGVTIPIAGLEDCDEEEAEYYSSVNFLPTTSDPTGDNKDQSNQTQVKLNPLYCSILTQPAIKDSGDVHSVPKSH
ncbi:hypothetical protein E1301_Tti021534 [Triplophysa tibetana]|uniref:Ig-like domain-containing protein n=1 Tax=Triplophysa tibetana TaxID=1572043 RepID=A0A5A9NDL7_9TELE|nr:hypothetical protein E1301_Tti021534 [Triplophysa tibetana]